MAETWAATVWWWGHTHTHTHAHPHQGSHSSQGIQNPDFPDPILTNFSPKSWLFIGQKSLTIALGYGGRQEILDAIKSLIDENRNNENDFDALLENVTDDQLRQHLYSPESPDIDLIIRTSGESRLSGFLLWQSAYSEVIFQDVYWPEFRKIDFLRCLREYTQRERRFGQ